MKIAIEKVAEGVKLTITYDTAKQPFVKVMSPAEVEIFIGFLRTALSATSFKFEYQA